MTNDVDETGRRALSIAASLATANAGEKAAARRMGDDGAPIYWRQVARLEIPKYQESVWLRFTRMLALLTSAGTETSIHQDKRPVGAVLADGGDAKAVLSAPGQAARPVFSEARMARLLGSRDEARLEALERAIRMIARNSPRIDVVDLANVVLGRGGSRLARAYYHRIERPQTNEVQNG